MIGALSIPAEAAAAITLALRALTALLVGGTLLSLVRRGEWWIRVWDFPRLQLGAIGIALSVSMAALAFATTWNAPTMIFVAIAALAGFWQLSHVIRYSPLRPVRVPGCKERDFRLVVSNLEVGNARKAEVARTLTRAEPEALLLLEIDAEWKQAMSALRSRFRWHVEEIAPEGLGMALWSNLPVIDPQVRFLVSERRPSIHAILELPDGRRVRFVGLHPAPPALPKPDRPKRYDSRIRDAELVKVAQEAADDDHRPWIVAGDFNDVAWSHTTRLFEEMSGLRDPRVGRCLLNTYHARRPLLRYPLDHIYLSPGFAVARIQRFRAPGSDHFAVLADLRLEHAKPPRPSADADDHREAETTLREGRRDADEDGEAA